MMFQHSYHNEIYVTEQRKRLLRDADKERVLNAIQAGNVRWHTRLMSSVGDMLIAGGKRLKARRYTMRRPLVASEWSFIIKD